MVIDWASFTPSAAVVGGLLIGVAASLFVLMNGRIAGISGILGGLVSRSEPGDRAWRIAFLLGLVISPLLWQLGAQLPPLIVEADYPLLLLAGFLVGISTRYGAGCTSGHGVCGISRLSPRSMIATLAFMASGFTTVFVIRHVIGG